MSKLPILQKNAYLSLVIKDNGIWAHLSYTDYNAQREYILTDYTDLNPLKQRLDDEFFTKNFWYEYFDNLEKVFNWDIVNRDKEKIFMFVGFSEEGEGVSGVRVLVDENQKFFNKIFDSLRAFSNDIALRIIDDSYIFNLLEGLMGRLEYEDIIYADLDLSDFKIYRAMKITDKGKESIQITKSKISWENEFGLIDSVKDSRFKAFLASDYTSSEILNLWSNFVLNRILFTEDSGLLDILRSYTTIQNYSIYKSNDIKLEAFGSLTENSCMILSGYIPMILGKQRTLMTLIDGLEIMGMFDCLWDLDKKILSYGKSFVYGPDSNDIILTKKELFKSTTKVLIPDVVYSKNPNKVVMSGYSDSLSIGKNEFYALSPQFTYIDLPSHEDKLVIETEFKNGTNMKKLKKKNVGFISVPGKKIYESLLVDARPRPIVYGPDIYTNKGKLSAWLNDFKA